jgi:hypothetical protein
MVSIRNCVCDITLKGEISYSCREVRVTISNILTMYSVSMFQWTMIVHV